MDSQYPTGKFVFDPNPTADSRRQNIAAIGSFPAELQAAMPAARIASRIARAAGPGDRSCTTLPTAT